MEMFFYGFMQRAIQASVLISLVAPILGLFLILRRQSLLADTLSHVSLTGVALGMMLNVNPTWTNLLVVILISLLLEWIRNVYHSYSEISIAVLMSGGMAFALFIMGMNDSMTADLNTFLFGSIVTISPLQVKFLYVLTIGIVLCYIIFKRPMYVLTFDEETAHTTGLPVRLMSILFNIITGITIAIIMPIVGSLLVSAILILPAAIAMRLSKSFNGVILFAMGIALIGMLGGLYISYDLGTPSGATIVLLLLSVFAIVLIGEKINQFLIEHNRAND
ncbi:metal ABC transporter permease [Allofustis seminis]|uniref:metal ABC transporter permease n=1 Tax=Allofustis seminis TaxID=166939 RepID=UPI000369627D|nr:metal ABC transporter permease [Allofustis seminis]